MTHSDRPYEDDEPFSNTLERNSYAPMYWVVMHNDPVTTMDFVVDILVQVFGLITDKAVEVMHGIHNNGLEKVAMMPLERAEFKVQMVRERARAKGFPLTCTIERD